MAIKKDGTVIIDTLVDTKGFGTGVRNMEKSVSGLSKSVGKLGVAIAAVFSVRAMINFGKEAVKLGSDLQEVQNVVDVSFGNMAFRMEEFADTALETFGISELTAKKTGSSYMAMAKGMSLASDLAADMALTLTGLSADIASFYNVTQDEARTALASVFTGETETLKRYGILITEVNLQEFARSKGIMKSLNAMTQQEKVMLRYQYILNATAQAQGDFERTSGSWANQTRILTEQFNSLKAVIGQGLINVLTPVVTWLNYIISRLHVVADGFRAFTEALFGKQSTGSSSSAESSLSDLEDGYDNVADAAKGAAKAQNSYLSGLDELNVISKSSGGGGADFSGLSDSFDFGKLEKPPILDETESAFDRLIKRAKELGKIFEAGFFDGLGNAKSRINSIKDSIDSIKKSLRYIFDEETAMAFNELIDTITYSLGQVVGSVASIGLTIGANLLGGIEKWLSEDKGKIKEYLLDMFDIGKDISLLIGEFSDSFAYVFEVFSFENAQQITADIIGMFADAFMGVTELISLNTLDWTELLLKPFADSKEEIRKSLFDMVQGFSSVTSAIGLVVSSIAETVVRIYQEKISPIFSTITEWLTRFLQENLSVFVTELGAFFTVIGELILYLWEYVVVPFIDWLENYLLPAILPIFEGILLAFGECVSGITDFVTALIEVYNGLITFVLGVFTSNWEKAWEGIKQIFKGVFDGIVAIGKTAINSLIGLINGFIESVVNGINYVIEALNKIKFDVPDWAPGIGGKSFKVSISKVSAPRIPYLATGAVIPPNAPFMAMLGDQTHGRNLEAPEDLIRQIVREESGMNAEMISILSQIAQNTRETADKDLTIGDREIARANTRGIRAMGYSLITEG